MAQTATLYRFRINVSDVERNVYEDIDLRVAMHPSEIEHYLLTRVLAFALNTERGLEFAPGGLSDADAPCIRGLTDDGVLKTWIEDGNPSARKLLKAATAAKSVKVYTYKDARLLLQDMSANKVHRADEIPVYALPPKFLDQLATWLKRDNDWSLIYNDGILTISSKDGNLETVLECVSA